MNRRLATKPLSSSVLDHIQALRDHERAMAMQQVVEAPEATTDTYDEYMDNQRLDDYYLITREGAAPSSLE